MRRDHSVVEQFGDEVSRLCREMPDPAQLAGAVAERLRPLVARQDWLSEQYRQPDPRDYRQHILYVAPGGAFSVVSLVWLPGQKTCIHNHVAWCVVGVCEGAERETRYVFERDAESGAPFLRPGTSRTSGPGQVCALAPGDDIHQVANAYQQRTVSVHVYGADIRQLGSSINQKFDHLPVRPAPVITC